MLHRDLAAARFLPRVSFGPRLVRLLRRVSVPAARVPAGLVVEDVPVPGPAAPIRVRVYRPSTTPPAPRPVLLWLHGGGHVIGWPEQDDRTCLAFASRLQATVASVDYRLSPEHPFPAALDDAHAVLVWLHNHAAERLLDPTRIAVGGASAGGGLAAALAQRVHDQGPGRLALQLLVYPMLDDRTPADAAPAGLRVWTPASNRYGWASYLGHPPATDEPPPYAVPARRDDLRGLPPAWIGVGSEDLFLAEDTAYARRLADAGVPVTLEVVEGAFHGFDAVLPRAGVSRRFLDAQVDALASAFARGQAAPTP